MNYETIQSELRNKISVFLRKTAYVIFTSIHSLDETILIMAAFLYFYVLSSHSLQWTANEDFRFFRYGSSQINKVLQLDVNGSTT